MVAPNCCARQANAYVFESLPMHFSAEKDSLARRGQLAAQHGGDGVELLADVLGVALGEDGADRRGDHLRGAGGNLGRQVAQRAWLTPLVCKQETRPRPLVRAGLLAGGAKGTRTPDPHTASIAGPVQAMLARARPAILTSMFRSFCPARTGVCLLVLAHRWPTGPLQGQPPAGPDPDEHRAADR
jgi:hypothetical protein